MLYGTVTQFFPQKGFGFIRADYGPDVFFHVSALGACRAVPEIRPGQPVKYDLVPGTEPKGRRGPRRREGSGPRDPEETGPKAQLVELIDHIPGGSLDDQAEGPPTVRHPRARRQKPSWRR